MTDLAILGQAGFWSINPADVTIFFGLLAHHIPMRMEADGTVWAAVLGKTFYVARLRPPEEGKED